MFQLKTETTNFPRTRQRARATLGDAQTQLQQSACKLPVMWQSLPLASTMVAIAHWRVCEEEKIKKEAITSWRGFIPLGRMSHWDGSLPSGVEPPAYLEVPGGAEPLPSTSTVRKEPVVMKPFLCYTLMTDLSGSPRLAVHDWWSRLWQGRV